ncbi:LAME_0H10418g1_1 [Lachancea meyersii CBS 8951]|uniref:Mediator of RNA polymerase II transcription subunit 6 n=1 Tax=Lachancea meyersii CBS 8951 TaxID=1266667 RepID=A0A1G4KG78_9SACH|nr:LAME_0H10418g1_1 [Lachancea meyersii CBS 8951]
MSAPQLDELQWKSPEWIQSFGLRTDNVLDYFAESPFFDRTSNNQVAKMQQQFAQPRPAVHVAAAGSDNSTGDPEQDPHRRRILSTYMVHALWDAELRKLKGVEYVLAYVREPDFWIIRKQNRTTPTSATPLQDYFIIGANVYQSPAAFKILHSRLLSANLHLSHALANLRRMSRFEPSQGGSFAATAYHTTPTVPHTASTVSSSTSGPNSAANTGPTTANAQSVLTSSADPGGAAGAHQAAVDDALMDKLLAISMKSTPVYL